MSTDERHSGMGSVATEAFGRFGGLQFREVEIANGAQSIRRRAILEIIGQSLEPRRIVALKHQQFGEALIGFRGGRLPHATRAPTRAPSRALPRRRALCTNWKKPRYSGNLSCEMPRCGRSQERSSDQKPSIVLTWTSQKPSPSSSRAYSLRAWQMSTPERKCIGAPE